MAYYECLWLDSIVELVGLSLIQVESLTCTDFRFIYWNCARQLSEYGPIWGEEG